MSPSERIKDVRIAAPPDYPVLYDVVSGYPGILDSSAQFFDEIQRHPRNWQSLITELRGHALKNFSLHDHHPDGINAMLAVTDIFLEALANAGAAEKISAVDGMLFYFEKIIFDGHRKLQLYAPVLDRICNALLKLPAELMFRVISNSHQLKKPGLLIFQRQSEGFDPAFFDALYFRYLSDIYSYWLNEKGPAARIKKAGLQFDQKMTGRFDEIFFPVSPDNMKGLSERVSKLDVRVKNGGYEVLKEMLELPSYSQIVAYYEDLAQRLPATGDAAADFRIKTIFLIGILETGGLADIHEIAIRQLGRVLVSFVRSSDIARLREMLLPSMNALSAAFKRYPDTTLYTVQLIGNEIYDLDDSGIVDWFSKEIILSGFQYPMIQGMTGEWQTVSNKSHLKNIRTWLELIEKNPKWSKPLISALLINLTLAGVHINDTDVFQKDITNLLNSDIRPVYHFVKQLAKVFPAYFNVINAEGELREVSTALDDATHTADPLVHFLRKHSHVESSSIIVDFAEEVFRFWISGDKKPLACFLPEDVIDQVSETGIYVDDMHKIFAGLFPENLKGLQDLLALDEPAFREAVMDIQADENEKKRAWLAVRFYQILYEKYRLSFRDIGEQLKAATARGIPSADQLLSILEDGAPQQKLDAVLEYLEALREIILCPEKFEAVEDIAHKRHIAVGIPSMYGRYTERKFNALSITYRLENLANILFGELMNSINLTYVTRASLVEIEKFTHLFYRALKLDGISSNRFETALELLSGSLDVRRFSFSQYIDIFRGFAEAVQDIVNTYCSGIHKGNMKVIIPQIGAENMLPKFREPSKGQNEFEFINKVAEQFLRETVAASFSIQPLDVFVSRILKTLIEQASGLDVKNLDLLMSYDQKQALADIHVQERALRDRIHLGNKGYNLVRLAGLGVNVPPGFIATTEVFRCREAINRFKYAREHLNERIEEELVKLQHGTGKIFGDPSAPLLVSVRSGAAISMPGMMDSLLNVGINEEIVEGLIKQKRKGWFAWDCYRRFLQGWGMSFGMQRDDFDAIMDLFKKRYGVRLKIEFSPDQMKEIARAYRTAVEKADVYVPDDPNEQLQVAIEQVFNSWMSAKAQNYREVLSLSENWGTAVIVQEMIFGNLDVGAGTGVLFTRNPREASDRVMLWGDFTMGAQGEDIVSGLVKTLPLCNEQKIIEERGSDPSLEDMFPLIYQHLLKIMKRLIYEQGWSAQEIEFTFEGSDPAKLYILQARDMSVTRKEVFMVFVPSPELNSGYLSGGIGVGGGAMSGRAAFDLDDIRQLRGQEPYMPVILLRADTVPDDIRHIAAADGLLTARGGSTSHAAIIAGRLGKTCVVGCSELVVLEQEKKCRLKGMTINAGDFISIDGRKGAVYLGAHKVREVMPLS